MANDVNLPLTYTEIVDEIVQFTTLPRKEVEYKVWMQSLQPGWNVLQDVARFGVTPHISNKKMDQLYEEGDGFIFETLVFWAKPERQQWSQQALERIRLYATQKNLPADDISILIFGDGTGNDSIYFATQGFQVDYFDVPGSKTFQFAMNRFEKYGFLGKGIRVLPDYQSCFNREYDIVISFEVLEHVPEPLTTIRDIASVLKMEGIALITEDFGDIIPRLPTHLKANSKYLGQTPFLFLRNKMLLSWYSRQILFKPMEFVKTREVSPRDRFSLMRDFNIRSSYLSRYFIKPARFIEKLPYFRM
jgi:SAM-dependent methyltransferase